MILIIGFKVLFILSPGDKILALSKLQAFAYDKLNLTQYNKFVFHGIENIVGK